MNGRIYDYNLGRFLSVDPFIQSPTNSQSMNPYSYIMNNPLAGTDPTGYTAEELKKPEKVEITGSRIKRDKSSITVSGSKITTGAGNLSFTGSVITSSNGNGKKSSKSDSANSGDSTSIIDFAGNNSTSGDGLSYLQLEKDKTISDFDDNTQEYLTALDGAIGEYRGKLESMLSQGSSPDAVSSNNYHDALEALHAFDNTDWVYEHSNNKDYATGSLSGGFSTKSKSQGVLKFIGDRKVTFYKNSIDVMRQGVGKNYDSDIGYTYKSLPKGGKGLSRLVAHEASHTIVSRMFKASGTVYKAGGKKGFEAKADNWALKMEGF